MPTTNQIAVKDLVLDLANFRTTPQSDEAAAVAAMISTSSERFWALLESILMDGYLPTESIIVLKAGGKRETLIVKEGNRRVAAMKFLHGILPLDNFVVPESLADEITRLSAKWRETNKTVPCTVYDPIDAPTVDRIVTLAHGKGEKASRDQWNAVARARHNREASRGSEPALDLLEKYLTSGRNITATHKAQWAGDFPLSVLEEAIRKIATRLGVSSAADLALQYPKVKNREALETIISDIGQKQLGFAGIRSSDVDFGSKYGVPPVREDSKGPADEGAAAGTGSTKANTRNKGTTASSTTPQKPKALEIRDPRAVKQLLKDFVPRGKNREKVASLRVEATRLDLTKTPFAFCFVLRSIFEVSAKAYCTDHSSTGGPPVTKADGSERVLADVLRDITAHLTKGKTDREMVKALHGAMTELGKKEGLLSVTSLNQLVHSPTFSVAPSDIATVFGNVFPLLQAMNN